MPDSVFRIADRRAVDAGAAGAAGAWALREDTGAKTIAAHAHTRPSFMGTLLRNRDPRSPWHCNGAPEAGTHELPRPDACQDTGDLCGRPDGPGVQKG